ncbi:hypothetical protein VNO80_30274 [Phaseolus coccineus]|uniref:Uncharacterized protein n=1 Tax=Phaseolus coccineus TaxID=3886 RepID=A0AAN9QDB0_PHACN
MMVELKVCIFYLVLRALDTVGHCYSDKKAAALNWIEGPVAGALGGFNAHARNIVSAIYIATGQDPAQIVKSSHCITVMEAVKDGKELHVSVTVLSIEVQRLLSSFTASLIF